MCKMPTKFKKIKKPGSLLGKTIGIYGDSFAVRPVLRIHHDGKPKLMSPGLRGEDDDIDIIRSTYLQEDWGTPQDNPHNISWWTYQISQRFETAVHYGLSGSGPEHMIYNQIDVNNNFEKIFPKHKKAKNIVPDVMILCWSDPTRVYVDPCYWFYETKILTAKEIHWLNTRGSPTNFEMIDNDRFFEDGWLTNPKLRRFSTMIKHHTELVSQQSIRYNNLGLKILFDQRWHPQLKKINPNLKVIHFDCFHDVEDLNHTFENGIWVKNFVLERLERAEGKQVIKKLYHDPDWSKTICHMPFQKQNDFLTNILVDLIHNYQDLDTNFDFSNWKDQYNML